MDELDKFLTDLHANEGKKFFSRDDAMRLFAALGNPQNRPRSIHIVGTNGKGSVSAMLAAIVRASGRSVGHTCSPHLYDVTERCLVNGRPQNRTDYLAAVRHVHDTALRLGFAGHQLTFFVITLAASFCEFARLGLDWTVIEAGLGGRDDATNVLENCQASVLTSIGYDHVELLGSTLPAIAEKKAGIARRGVPFFVGEVPQEVKQTIREAARRGETSVEFAGEDFSWDAASKSLSTKEGQVRLDLDHLSLRGMFQKRNAILAARAALACGFSAVDIEKGLSSVRWPGRCEMFEVMSGGQVVNVLLDVAHNEEGMQTLGREISRWNPTPTEIVFIVSMLERKHYRAALDALRQSLDEIARSWVCTSSRHSHVRSPHEIADFLWGRGERRVLVEEDPARALHLSISPASETEKSHRPLIVVIGSVYLAARVRPLLTDRPIETIVERM